MNIDNSYLGNVRTGATPNPVIEHPDAIDAAFEDSADETLALHAELVRRAVPSHQAAIAIIVDGDWQSIRKYFSLSEKYAAWAEYNAPARGLGLHEWLRHQPGSVRMTTAEFETHPAFAHFSGQTGHPPMRGWLARAIRDRAGTVWGIVQLSDRADGGEYDQNDEDTFNLCADAVTATLDALWDLRNARKDRA